MERIAFFDAKPYDRIYFDKLNRAFELVYFESRLRPESVKLAAQSARSSTTTSVPQLCAPSRTSVWR